MGGVSSEVIRQESARDRDEADQGHTYARTRVGLAPGMNQQQYRRHLLKLASMWKADSRTLQSPTD